MKSDCASTLSSIVGAGSLKGSCTVSLEIAVAEFVSGRSWESKEPGNWREFVFPSSQGSLKRFRTITDGSCDAWPQLLTLKLCPD